MILPALQDPLFHLHKPVGLGMITGSILQIRRLRQREQVAWPGRQSGVLTQAWPRARIFSIVHALAPKRMYTAAAVNADRTAKHTKPCPHCTSFSFSLNMWLIFSQSRHRSSTRMWGVDLGDKAPLPCLRSSLKLVRLVSRSPLPAASTVSSRSTPGSCCRLYGLA